MLLAAIDPGTTESGLVIVHRETLRIEYSGKVPNHEVCRIIGDHPVDSVVIEMPASYGMPVGRTVFQTLVWIGRFSERLKLESGLSPYFVGRKSIVTSLCGSSRAKDSNVRAALIELYRETFPESLGGGSEPVVGTKAKPGPLYRFAGDMYAALALAVASKDTHVKKVSLDEYCGIDEASLEAAAESALEEFSGLL